MRVRGLTQKMVTDTGEAKGMQTVLSVRESAKTFGVVEIFGRREVTMSLECGQSVYPLVRSNDKTAVWHAKLSQEPDLKNQVSKLERVLTQRGHLCIFLPKFHYEMNPIEQVQS